MADDSQRLDKWLWCARFFRSRTLATRFCQQARIRLNGNPVGKAHQGVRAGDVLTFPLGRQVRVIRVLGRAPRRGPAAEARALYDDLEPPAPIASAPPTETSGRREPGSGRPTKREGRQIARLQGRG